MGGLPEQQKRQQRQGQDGEPQKHPSSFSVDATASSKGVFNTTRDLGLNTGSVVRAELEQKALQHGAGAGASNPQAEPHPQQKESKTTTTTSSASPSSTNDIMPNSQMCIMKVFDWWFVHKFYETRRVPFSVACLHQLIDETSQTWNQKPKPNLNLVATLIRKRYAIQLAQAETIREDAGIPTRYLLYRCHKWCGGLGDRLRGTTFALFSAILTKSRFGMFHQPVQWDPFFEAVPELYDLSQSFFDDKPWYDPIIDLDEQLQEHRIPFAAFEAMDKGDPAKTPNNGPPFNLTRAFFSPEAAPYSSEPHHITLVRMNFGDWVERLAPQHTREFRAYRLDGLGWADFQHLFMRLYMGKYTPYLQDGLKPYLAQLGIAHDENTTMSAMTFVGAQRRQTELSLSTTQQTESQQPPKPFVVGMQVRLGSWNDPTRQSLQSVDLMTKQTAQICQWQQQHNQHNRPCRVWLTSDSTLAIERVQASLAHRDIPVIVNNGKIVHIDHKNKHKKTNDDARTAYNATQRAHLKTFVDWIVLALSPNAYVISRSGFSASASWYLAHIRTGYIDYRPKYMLVESSTKPFGYELQRAEVWKDEDEGVIEGVATKSLDR